LDLFPLSWRHPNVWQEHASDTTKKGIPTKDKFSYGTNEHPSPEVYQLARVRRLSGSSRIHTIDEVKHALVENGPVFIALPLYNSGPAFWKSDSRDSDQAHDFHAVSIEGYDTNGFFRNSWGSGTMAVATCHSPPIALIWTFFLARKKETTPESMLKDGVRSGA